MSEPTQSLSAKLGLTLVATSAVYLAPDSAAANIVTMASIGGTPFAVTLQASPISWDVNHDGTTDFTFWGQTASEAIGVQDGAGNGWVLASANPNSAGISNLAAGFGVGSEPGYHIGATGSGHAFQSYGAFYDLSGFTDGVPGYSGIEFQAGGYTHYGWVQWAHLLSPGEGLDGQLIVLNWAYQDTPNTPIPVGATSSASVPEPNSLALLAGGVGGLLAWRRRKSGARAKRTAA